MRGEIFLEQYFIGSNGIGDPSSFNVNVSKAKDSYLYDENHKYIDLRSGLWNVSLGYNSKLYNSVKKEFNSLLDRGVPYVDINAFNHELYEGYASELLAFMDNKKYKAITYTTSGSEAVEMSVKISHDIAKILNKKSDKIVIFKNSYHGTFFGSMTVSHHFNGMKDAYNLVNDVIVVEPPQNEADLVEILSIINESKDEIASFIIEPVVGSGGCIVIKKPYLERIIEECENHCILTIFDEISTGFYRTGTRFSFSLLNHKPNIVLLSKSINNGIVPFGVLAIDKGTYNYLKIKNINHFSTQSGNLLGVVSAKVTLDYWRNYEIEVINNVQYIESSMQYMINKYDIKVNGVGAMYSIPINDFNHSLRLMDELKKMGILVYAYHNPDETSGITIFPNLLMDRELWERALNIVFKKVVR